MRHILAFLLFAIMTCWAGFGAAASYTPPRTFFTSTAAVTATGSSTSAQSLIGTGISQDGTTSPTLPANFFSVAGSGLDIFASGYYSSGTITTQTATFTVKLGSTTLLASSAVTPISGVTSGAWMMHCKVTAYTVGSSGTLQANCGVTLTGSTLTPADVPLVNTSTVSLNATTTQAVTTTITWGGSPTSSQTITATNYVLSYIDAPMRTSGGKSFVNAAVGTDQTGTALSSISTAAQNVTAGNDLLVGCRTGIGVGTISVTDTAGNPFTSTGALQTFGSANLQVFESTSVAGNASDVITCNDTATAPYDSVISVQLAGGTHTWDSAAHAVATSTSGTTATTASFSTSAANEAIVTFGAYDNNSATWSPGAIGGTTATLTTCSNGLTSGDTCAEYRLANSMQSSITAAISINATHNIGAIEDSVE